MDYLLFAQAGFAALTGVAILGLWVTLLRNGSVDELESAPNEIVMHIGAETLTALALVASAAALIADVQHAMSLWFLGMGMLIYTLINSSGYYLQRGERPILMMFGALLLISLTLIVLVVL